MHPRRKTFLRLSILYLRDTPRAKVTVPDIIPRFLSRMRGKKRKKLHTHKSAKLYFWLVKKPRAVCFVKYFEFYDSRVAANTLFARSQSAIRLFS